MKSLLSRIERLEGTAPGIDLAAAILEARRRYLDCPPMPPEEARERGKAIRQAMRGGAA